MQLIGILLLLFLILFVYFLNLKTSDFDISSPSSIISFMTILSISVMALFSKQYGIDLSLKCIFLVFLSVVSFSLPSFFVPNRIYNTTIIKDVEVYRRQVLWFSFILVGTATYLYYNEVKRIAGLIGFSSTSTYGMLYYYRSATLMGGEEIASQSALVGQLMIASHAISYLMLVDFIQRIVFNKIKCSKFDFFIELLTLCGFIGQCILSGGRTQFLYFIESFLVLFIIIQNKKTGNRISFNIAKRVFTIIILTVISFYFLGNLTGKTGKLNMSETIFVYIGSPIEAFNKLINNEVSFNKSYFGANVFIGPIDLLNRLGMHIEQQVMVAPFVKVGSTETNIFGSFGRYYSDFGFLGLIFVNLFIGIIYQKIHLVIQKKNTDLVLILAIYMIISKVVFDFCIEERFFLSVLSLGTIIRCIYMVIFYNLFSYRIKIGDRLVI